MAHPERTPLSKELHAADLDEGNHVRKATASKQKFRFSIISTNLTPIYNFSFLIYNAYPTA
jgi:hypothetical protein